MRFYNYSVQQKNIIMIWIHWGFCIFSAVNHLLTDPDKTNVIRILLFAGIPLIFLTILAVKNHMEHYLKYAFSTLMFTAIIFLCNMNPDIMSYLFIFPCIALLTIYQNIKHLLYNYITASLTTIYIYLNDSERLIFLNSDNKDFLYLIIILSVMFGMFVLDTFIRSKRDAIEQEKNLEMEKDKNTIERLNDEVRHSVQSANTLTDTLNEEMASTNEAANNVLLTTKEMTYSLENQNNSLQDINLSIHSINQEINLINQSVGLSNQTIHSSTQLVTTAQKEVQTLDFIIKDLKEMIENNAENALELRNKSSEISNIITVISDIASQTNLLSLNASIEASRAGEHGKGFGVVAEEIKKLAQQSAQSADDIRKILEKIKADTETSVEQTDRTKSKILIGEKATSKVSEAFQTIFTDNQEIANQFLTIETKMKQLEEEATVIVDEVNNVSSISEENAASIEEMYSQVEIVKDMLARNKERYGKIYEDLTKLEKTITK